MSGTLYLIILWLLGLVLAIGGYEMECNPKSVSIIAIISFSICLLLRLDAGLTVLVQVYFVLVSLSCSLA